MNQVGEIKSRKVEFNADVREYVCKILANSETSREAEETLR